MVAFTVGGETRRYVPAFTGIETLGLALEVVPEWGELSMVEVTGHELLANLQPSTVIAKDPWSEREFKLPLTS